MPVSDKQSSSYKGAVVKEWPVLAGDSPVEKDFYAHVRRKLDGERRKNEQLRTAMKDKGKTLKDITDRLQGQMENSLERIEELQNELTREREKNSKLLGYMSHLEHDVVDSVAIIDGAKRELQNTKGLYDALRKSKDEQFNAACLENSRLKEDIDASLATINDLRAQLNTEKEAHKLFRSEGVQLAESLQKESAELRERVQKAEKLAEDLRIKLKDKIIIYNETQERATEQANELSDVRSMLTESRQAVVLMSEESSRRIEMLEARICEQDKILSEREALIEQAKVMRVAQSIEIQTQKQALREHKEKYSATDAIWSTRVNELEMSNMELRKKISEKSEAFRQVEMRCQNQALELAACRDTISTQEDKAARSVADLSNRIKTMAAEMSALSIEVAEKNELIDQAKAFRDAQNLELQAQRKIIQEGQKYYQEKEGQLAESRTALDSMRKQLVLTEERLEEWLRYSEGMQVNNQKLQEELSCQQELFQEAQAANQRLTLELSENVQYKRLEEMRKELQSLEVLLADKNSEIVASRAERASEREKDRQLISRLQDDLNWRWSVAKELKDKNDVLRREYHAVQNDLIKERAMCSEEREKRRASEKQVLNVRRECREALDALKWGVDSVSTMAISDLAQPSDLSAVVAAA